MAAPAPFPFSPRPGAFAPSRPCPVPPRTRAGPPRAPAPLPPQPLHALLADLMAPVGDWGRLLLTTGNGMAELQCSLDYAHGVADGIDVWHLRGERHAAWLSERGIARIELVEPAAGSDEGDASAVSLSWHDRQGLRIARILLPSPGGSDQALLWLRQHGRPRTDACRRRRAAAAMPLMQVPHAGFTLVEALARGAPAAAWAAAAMLHLDRSAELRVDLSGTGAAVRCIGPLGAAHPAAIGLQALGPQCGLRLQPGQAVAVARVVDRDGVSGMLLDAAGGGRLLLQPQGAGAVDWFAGVAERVAQGVQSAIVYDPGPDSQPSP